jgi:NADH:ubiquinone oxidoreductase subunit F (NADH-binding)
MQTEEPIASFYHLPDAALENGHCEGLACFVARHLGAGGREQTGAGGGKISCLGRCYQAPVGPGNDRSGDGSDRPRIEIHAPHGIVLSRLVRGGAPSLAQYTHSGGYQALRKALTLQPAEVVREMEISQLRGRGGAGFPAGKKWDAVLRHPATRKFVVANADEGDPGAYIDRFLLEGDPHSIIEAVAISAYAVGAQRGFIYLRKEYPAAAVSLKRALEEAQREHFLGANVLGSGFSFELELVTGHGSYVCGEETALLNALEGKRPEVRVRPPYPTESGYMGSPTLINNVETLVNVPWIVLHGGAAYQRLGFSNSRGTKAISLNSLFRRPGLYEVEFGISVRQIVEELGGGLATGTLRGVMIGGPLAGIIPPHLLDTPFGFEELRAIGASVGHGGVIAFGERTSIVDLLRHVFEFGAFESCGKCTPCRQGSSRIVELLKTNGHGAARDHLDGLGGWQHRSELEAIVEALRVASVCGMGTGLAAFADSVLRYYERELTTCLA